MTIPITKENWLGSYKQVCWFRCALAAQTMASQRSFPTLMIPQQSATKPEISPSSYKSWPHLYLRATNKFLLLCLSHTQKNPVILISSESFEIGVWFGPEPEAEISAPLKSKRPLGRDAFPIPKLLKQLGSAFSTALGVLRLLHKHSPEEHHSSKACKYPILKSKGWSAWICQT